MKKLILFTYFFFLSLFSFAQAEQKEITSTLEKYNICFERKDFACAFDYIHPKFFSYVSKELMIKETEKVFKDSLISMSFSDFRIGSVSKPIEHNGAKYALVNYSMKMSMKFLQQMEKKDGLSIEEITLEGMKMTYGTDKAKYDPKTGIIEIILDSQMIAVNDPQFVGWKFIEKKDELNLVEELIPKEVLGKL